MNNNENNVKKSYYEKNKEKILKQQQEKRNAKYIGLREGYDYICCKECGFKSSELATHIINKHYMTVDEYKIKHNTNTVKSQKSIERVKGSNNPAFQHGGKYSPFSQNFINGTENIEIVKKKAKENKTKDKDNTQIEYWLKKTNGDLKKAEELLTERQTTFSLEKCIQKYGNEDGLRIWNDRQEKWLNSYKKTNFSKISQELFWGIYEKLEDKNNIRFAEYDNVNKCMDKSGKNYEKTIRIETFSFKPDFIKEDTKHIIEFDGDYWHGPDNKYRFDIKNDENKTISIIDAGYKILRIKEHEYKTDKQGTIERCMNFLKT